MVHLKDISDDSPCPAPSSTLVAVDHCPDSKETSNKAAKRKQCHQIGSKECKLEYHCVINPYGNITFEVCARPRLIFGGFCPEFSKLREGIQPNFDVDCKHHEKSCPGVFMSTDAYKYQECYPRVQKKTLFVIKTDSTDAMDECLNAIKQKHIENVRNFFPLLKNVTYDPLITFSTKKKRKICPISKISWDKAAEFKGCFDISKSCSDFLRHPLEYHCVMDPLQNEALEVCAPARSIVGGVCPTYSEIARSIQPNRDVLCKKCPFVYRSTDAFKYEECYKHVRRNYESTLGNAFSTPTTHHATHLSINAAAGMAFSNYIHAGAVFGGVALLGLR